MIEVLENKRKEALASILDEFQRNEDENHDGLHDFEAEVTGFDSFAIDVELKFSDDKEERSDNYTLEWDIVDQFINNHISISEAVANINENN